MYITAVEEYILRNLHIGVMRCFHSFTNNCPSVVAQGVLVGVDM